MRMFALFVVSSLTVCDCDCEEYIVVGHFLFCRGVVKLGEYNQYSPLY